MNILCLLVLCVSVYQYVFFVYLFHCVCGTELWRVLFASNLYQSMEDSFGGMFMITDSHYPVWKSKMRDMLVVKDLWLPV